MKRKPYSRYRRNGNSIYFTCLIGTDENDQLIAGGVEAETRKILETIQEDLKNFGLDFSYAMRMRIYLARKADYEEMNKVYESFWPFPYQFPARTCIVVGEDALWLGASVAIEATVSLSHN